MHSTATSIGTTAVTITAAVTWSTTPVPPTVAALDAPHAHSS
ncbi:hypothetical protein AB0O18_06715 [Streptomyces sp. NPDC093224]